MFVGFFYTSRYALKTFIEKTTSYFGGTPLAFKGVVSLLPLTVGGFMKRALVSAAFMLFVAQAQAAVMTFNGLSGTTSSPYSENGLTATPPSGGVLWAWPASGMAHLDPSGFGNGFIDFTFSGGVFDLLSVDILNDGGTGSNNGLWQAYLGATLVDSLTTSSLTDNTINFGSGFSGIDRVRVTNGLGTSHFSLDNVNFEASAIPEPGSLALLGLGLVGLAISRRKAKA